MVAFELGTYLSYTVKMREGSIRKLMRKERGAQSRVGEAKKGKGMNWFLNHWTLL